jgi:PHD/YefM family antitoxin component YafN of YafNO toxin-antitoxin module
MSLHPQFIVDTNGDKRGVVLPLGEYNRLLEMLEDVLDAADLDQAARGDEAMIPYEEVQKELRAEGIL